MGTGKTQFNFQTFGQPDLIAQYVHEAFCKYGYDSYMMNNMMFYQKNVNKRVVMNVESFVQGNNVTFYAYMGNSAKPKELKGMYAMAIKDSFKNEINTIIREVNERCNQIALNNASEYDRQYIQNTIMQNNQYVRQNTKSSSGYMVICLIFAIICSVSTAIGMTEVNSNGFLRIGPFFAIFIIVYAAKSLKTSDRKGLAILTILISSIALLLSVVSMLSGY